MAGGGAGAAGGWPHHTPSEIHTGQRSGSFKRKATGQTSLSLRRTSRTCCETSMMVVLQLSGSFVGRQSRFHADQPRYFVKVQSTAISREPNLKTEASSDQASSGSVPLGQPLAHNPAVAFTQPRQCMRLVHTGAIGGPKTLCSPENIRGGMPRSIAELKMSS